MINLSVSALIILALMGMESASCAEVNLQSVTANQEDEAPREKHAVILVSTVDDEGEGSLRQAILRANEAVGHDIIRFDSETGPFKFPQTIVLRSPLPDLEGEITLDGFIERRLWKPSGVTVSGAGRFRVFTIAPDAKATISYLTISAGYADNGGGVLNRGELVLKGDTFLNNIASQDGGGIANLGGRLTVINSTFVDNRAMHAGGGLYNKLGEATVTNATFSSNEAQSGGGLFSDGVLLLRNTILSNSKAGSDCFMRGILDPMSTHNLIEENVGCGQPISRLDPRLQKLAYYNGPTMSMPLGGGSPAINFGDNASAIDEYGFPLIWDQRGHGDPRFVAGITDIGAVETQAFPDLVVDTIEDVDLRACRKAVGDCSLRGAITLANAWSKGDQIKFDPMVFAAQRAINLVSPLPEVVADLTLDAGGTVDVVIKGNGVNLSIADGVNLVLHGVRVE